MLERQKCHLLLKFWYPFSCGKALYFSNHWHLCYICFSLNYTMSALYYGQHSCCCASLTVEKVDSELSQTFPRLLETASELLGSDSSVPPSYCWIVSHLEEVRDGALSNLHFQIPLLWKARWGHSINKK